MRDGLGVNAVIQARSSSTRLPGKVLRPLAGRSVLGWVVRAAAAAPGVDRVVVATSDAADDDAVAAEASRCGALVARGPLDDVVARFGVALEQYPADAVVRLTADCPLLDPALIGRLTAVWRAEPALDYVSTTLVRTLPRGFDAELVRAAVLAEQVAVAQGPDREHVTSGIYRQPLRYTCTGVVVTPPADDLRVTLDTPEDWELIAAVVDALGDQPASWQAVVALLRARPDLVALNEHVEQKKLGQ
ncbi:cytidylyltransferase domain-containing protein [Amycolatopsis sp. FDAARGOS 1241]|uniref:cytidylyltransferase domain-containing protein n=1 Tax=Amycolatopsis sp. FDAARGOS 1241 TaxID=2778070 RepID=UPI00194FF4CA|nr:NTP transferase domain-containing protein [Amycolatopsis sp. FDAARGOS 1241]QRP45824.1 NTP transferase domain-containing protein [Amycolatopsis sp. FDAARGOS 1241]